MKNMQQIFQQAQAMQKKMQEAQEKLDEIIVDGSAGGNMVKVQMTCKGEVKSLKIDPSLVDAEEIEVLEDLVVAAINDAKAKAQQKTEDEMSGVTGGLGLPGGMKLPF